MRKGLSFLLMLMLVRFAVVGQVLSPALQIAETNGVATVSWFNVQTLPLPTFSLQTTTNLSPPVTWNNLPLVTSAIGRGTTNVALANPQQFFRFAQMLPIFQFAIFYNVNMELDFGLYTTVNGPVFCDDSIWAGSYYMTFNSSVVAAGLIATNASDPFTASNADYNGNGSPTFKVPPVSGANVLNLSGLGTNNDPAFIQSLLNLPPSGTDPYSSTGQLYFINQTDLTISNSPSGVISADFQDANQVNPVTLIPYDSQIIANGTTNYAYTFVTNTTFYDYREGKTVQAVQLDVGALINWIASTNGSSFNTQLYHDTKHYIQSVYIYNNAPYTSTSLPSVRVANGTLLPPQGFTVVTPDPLYVLGNYNVTNAPAALIGDSITALSTTWSDTYNSSTPLIPRGTGPATINAAIFVGIVPSVGTNYSGGVENSIRFLENWVGNTFTYNGSIAVMFPSQYATNRWQVPGIYYTAPTRHWSFNQNFLQPNLLPPLTPWVVNFISQ